MFPGEELLMVVCVAQVSLGRAIDGFLCCAGFLGKSYRWSFVLRRFPGEELLMVVCVAQVSWGRAIDGRLCCAGFLGKSY